MDIISMGAATKAGMEESKTRKQTLEIGVIGAQASVAKRLEVLEAGYLQNVKRANELIIKDTLNIMKAHTRLNTIAQSKRYQMENLLFDDLVDASGIDAAKSSNYTHNPTLQTLATGASIATILTMPITVEQAPTRFILNTDITMVSTSEKNIANKGTYTIIGGYQRWTPAALYDGNSSDTAWDDSNASETQGFTIQLPVATMVSKIRICSHSSYPMQGFVLEYGNKDYGSSMSSSTSFSGWKDLTINAMIDRIRITRVSGTQAKDQAINEIEIYEKIDSLVMQPSDTDSYEVSRDGGVTWQTLPKNQLIEVDGTKALPGKSVVLKMKIPANRNLMNYALTWA